MDMTGPSSTAGPAEPDLVASLQAGEREAFEQFVRRFCDPMYYVARRILRDDEDTLDVIQDAFFKAFRSIAQYQGRAELKTWLHRIVVNTALMKLRSRKRRRERSIDELLPGFADDDHHLHTPRSFVEITPDELARAELRSAVLQCIDQLPENYRTVVLLRDIEQLDTAETAGLLGISEMVVRARLHRGRMALRGLLEPILREGRHELS